MGQYPRKQPTKKLIRTAIKKVSYRKFLEKWKKCGTKKENEFLIDFSILTSNFCRLSKIRKSKIVQDAIKEQQKQQIHIVEPSDLKLLPIEVGPICPTRLNLYFSETFSINIKNYLKDNIDF